MKKYTFISTVLIALFSLTFIGCDKDDDEMLEFDKDSNLENIDFRTDIDEDDPVEVLPDTISNNSIELDNLNLVMDIDEDDPVETDPGELSNQE